MPHTRGEQHPGSRLTAQDVLDIRAEHEPRVVTTRMLAERYGVSEGTIRDVVLGRTWRHLLPGVQARMKSPHSSLEQRSNAPSQTGPLGRSSGASGGSRAVESARNSGTPLQNRQRPRRVCREPDCEALVHARGFCDAHYRRSWRKYRHLVCAVEGCTNHQDDGSKGERMHSQRSTGRRGDQTGQKSWLCREHERLHLAPSEAIEQLNLDRLAQRIKANENGCWLWAGKRNSDGYGLFDPEGANLVEWFAHRALFDLLVGGHAHTLQLDHRCDERQCIAPFHLRPVTGSANSKRRGKAVADPVERKTVQLPAVQRFARDHGLPLPR